MKREYQINVNNHIYSYDIPQNLKLYCNGKKYSGIALVYKDDNDTYETVPFTVNYDEIDLSKQAIEAQIKLKVKNGEM